MHATVDAELRRLDLTTRYHLYFPQSADAGDDAPDDLALNDAERRRWRRCAPLPSDWKPSWRDLMVSPSCSAKDSTLNSYWIASGETRQATLRCLDRSTPELVSHLAQLDRYTRQRARTATPPRLPAALQGLLARTDIVVRPADKNLGLCVMSAAAYDAVAAQMLSDNTTYRRLSTGEAASAVHDAFEAARTHAGVAPDGLPQGAYKALENAYSKRNESHYGMSTFYLLPKLHKRAKAGLAFAGRPIVASHKWPLTPLSSVVAILLQRAVEAHCPQVLRDSSDLVRRLERLNIPPGRRANARLAAADVEALYPSMLHDVTLAAVRFYAAKVYSPEITDWIVEAVRLGLFWNTLTEPRSGATYRQLQGAAMGNPAAPQLGNLYMAYLEDRDETGAFIGVPDILFWARFVDDIVLLVAADFDCAALQLRAVPAQNDELPHTFALTWEWSAQEAAFLDLRIILGARWRETGCPDLALFTKPLNRYLYVPFTSAHPRHQLRGFVKGELMRFARVCSQRTFFDTARRAFWLHLRLRGYPRAWLTEAFAQVDYSQRAAFLVQRPVVLDDDALFHALRVPACDAARLLRVGAAWQRGNEALRAAARRHGRRYRATVAWTLGPSLWRRLAPLRGAGGGAGRAAAPAPGAASAHA